MISMTKAIFSPQELCFKRDIDPWNLSRGKGARREVALSRVRDRLEETD